MFSDDEELNLEIVIYIHDRIISESGGALGIHSEELVRSALARPEATAFGESQYDNEFTKAAAALHSIALNHGFRDGNKRTAMAVAVVYLELNGLEINFTNDEYESFMLYVVKDRPGVGEISEWLTSHSKNIE